MPRKALAFLLPLIIPTLLLAQTSTTDAETEKKDRSATTQVQSNSSAENSPKTKSSPQTTSTSSTESEIKTDAEVPAAPNDPGTEKIQVVGSYIRRTDVEGPSPVIVIDRQQIENSGFNDVGTLLANSAVTPFGGSGSSVGLQGLGSARTLVLINGQRAPASGSSYATGAVSTNFVPMAAVERIEVLNDGASAIYGADALGGVVNIITRKDLDGIAVVNKYDLTGPNGGDSNRASVAYGSHTSSSSFMTSMQVQYSQGYRKSDLDYAKSLNRSYQFSTNYYDTTNTAPGIQPGPNCTLIENGVCNEFVSPKQVTLPSLSVDWVTDYTKDLGSDIKLYSTLIAGYYGGKDQFPNVLNTPGETLGMAFTGAQAPGSWASLPGYTGGDGIRVYHRMDDYINTTFDQQYYGGLILGLKGFVADSDWEWNVSANNQINIYEGKETNLATVSSTKQAIISGAYDPFDPTKRDTSGLGIDALNRNHMNVNWFQGVANGSLGRFLGTDWSAAFGSSFAHFDYVDNRAADIINNNVMMQSGVVGHGGRELYAAFTEMSGLVGNQLEIQLAARADHYTDFGDTFNPKLALRYKPTNWVFFRTSASTGFQAPTLQDMNAKIRGYNFEVDQVLCSQKGQCNTLTIPTYQDNNPNLKPEKSESVNIGAVVQPTKNLNFSLDWRFTKVKNTIGFNISDILRLEDVFGSSAPGNYGVNIVRDPVTNQIQRVEYQLYNVGTEQVDSLYFDANYLLKTRVGDFNFNNSFVYMGHYYQKFYSEFGNQQVLGMFGKPRWRNNFTLGYTKNRFSVQTTFRSFADMHKRVMGPGMIVSPTQIYMIINYDWASVGTFQLGANNLFNIRPHFDNTYGSRINGDLFARTQTFYLTYRKTF